MVRKSEIKKFLEKEIFEFLQKFSNEYNFQVAKAGDKIIIRNQLNKEQNDQLLSELISKIYTHLILYVNEKKIANLPILTTNTNDNMISIEV